ncbi:MAG: AAA family ATPase, partial [Actinobacteria bacterium]|nr:AAA family ATPase [Actinomycetota bacterium]
TLAPGLELKSDMVVAPPSLNPDGTARAWAPGRSILELKSVPLPEALTQLAHTARARTDALVGSDEPIGSGDRHEALKAMARKLRATGMGASSACAALAGFNLARCQPPKSEEEIARLIEWEYTQADAVVADSSWALGNGHSPNGVASFVVLESVEEREISFYWKGRIPNGMVTLVAGDGGVGKSTAVQDLGARMTQGKGAPGEVKLDRPRGVVILSGEESTAAVIRPRMRLAGAELERVRVLDLEQAGFTLPSGVSALHAACVEADAGMVIVDTGPAFLDQDLKSNTEEDIRRLMRPLMTLAQDLDLVVLVLAHFNKGEGRDSRHRVMGGAAWVNASRSVLFIGPPPGANAREVSDRMVAVEKSNLAAYPPALAFRLDPCPEDSRYPQVEWGEEVEGVSASDLVSRAPSPADKTERDEAKEFLAAELAGGGVPSEDLKKKAKEEGISWATLRRAQKEMGIKAIKEPGGMNSPWIWKLPPPETASKGKVLTPPLKKESVSTFHENRLVTEGAHPDARAPSVVTEGAHQKPHNDGRRSQSATPRAREHLRTDVRRCEGEAPDPDELFG